MKLSTKGRYGTRAMVDLALHYGQGPIQLKEIAQREDIPLQYLERLMAPLIAAGIVKSTRGAHGGVYLLKEPQEIKLSEVIQVLEGSIAPVECIANPEVCSRSASCVTRDVWDDLKKAMDGVLENTTLQNLVERHNRKQRSQKPMYHI